MMHFAIIGFVLVSVGAGIFVYGKVLQHYMTDYADGVGKAVELDATSGWDWVLTKIRGWKTIVLSWISATFGALSLIPADALQKWTDLPWSQVIDQRTAAIISIITGFLIPILHGQSLAHAASVAPQNGD